MPPPRLFPNQHNLCLLRQRQPRLALLQGHLEDRSFVTRLQVNFIVREDCGRPGLVLQVGGLHGRDENGEGINEEFVEGGEGS